MDNSPCFGWCCASTAKQQGFLFFHTPQQAGQRLGNTAGTADLSWPEGCPIEYNIAVSNKKSCSSHCWESDQALVCLWEVGSEWAMVYVSFWLVSTHPELLTATVSQNCILQLPPPAEHLQASLKWVRASHWLWKEHVLRKWERMVYGTVVETAKDCKYVYHNKGSVWEECDLKLGGGEDSWKNGDIGNIILFCVLKRNPEKIFRNTIINCHHNRCF